MRVFTKIASLLLLLSLSLASMAQMPNPIVPPVPIGNIVKVTVSPKWKALTFSATAVNHITNQTGTQIATFSLTAQVVQLKPGWTCQGYQWAGAIDTTPPQIMPMGLVVTTNSHAATATGEAYSPGVYTASCTFDLVNGQGQHYPTSASAKCAVIGGPITITVSGAEKPTYSHDSNDPTEPFFLQYFAYSHYQTRPTGFQSTQNGWAQVPVQPDGTYVTWFIPPADTVCSTILDLYDGQPNVESIDMAAEKVFTGESILVWYHYDFVDTDGTVYQCDGVDDTPSTLVPGYTDRYMVSKISAHKPGTLTTGPRSGFTPSLPPGTIAWAATKFKLNLFDTGGEAYPGVYIQERYVPVDPPAPGFGTNKSEGLPAWYTLLSPAGESNEFDYLWFAWTTDTATRVFVHHYWSATQNYTTGGIDMGAFTMTFSYGPPPTASQTP